MKYVIKYKSFKNSNRIVHNFTTIFYFCGVWKCGSVEVGPGVTFDRVLGLLSGVFIKDNYHVVHNINLV